MSPNTSADLEGVDGRIDTQAEWLANHTVLSKRQAETVVRDALGGNITQRQIAEKMGIGESTVSNHLHAVDEATDPDTASMAYWLFFGPGPINPVTYRAMTVWTSGSTEWVVVFKQQFPEYANSYAPEYYVVHQHVDRDVMDDVDDAAAAYLSDAQFRYITDQYEFDSLSDLESGLPRVVEFDSDRKREQFEEMFEAYCDVEANKETAPGTHR